MAAPTATGERQASAAEPDLVIFCEDLADSEVWGCIRQVRHISDVPIVVVAERREEIDVVKAFELGADDYIGCRAT